MTATAFEWEVDLSEMVGAFCKIETTDGSIREGKITGVNSHPVQIDGEVYDLPKCVELNGDTSDTIDFYFMRSLELR